MVGPDIEYVVVESDLPTGTPERYVLGEERLAAYRSELGERRQPVVERLTGRDLLGRSYTPPMTYFLGHEQAFRVVEADFVTTADGTGLVHTAGAFGEEDKAITDREGIELVVPVAQGRHVHVPGRPTTPGMHVFDANLPSSTTSRRCTRRDGERRAERHARHGAAAPRDLRALLPALLALPASR